MTRARRSTSFIFSIGLSAGLLFAQICQVVCLAASCANEKPAPTSSSAPCHSVPNAPQPAPPDESHNCQNHELLLLSALEIAGTTLSDNGESGPSSAFAIVPAYAALIFMQQRMERTRFSSLRSPPRLPQRLILRI
jgi:hypothetical protein